MEYLLDSCSFLWMAGEPSRLSTRAAAVISEASATLYISALTVAEISIKYQLGKLMLASSPYHLCRKEAELRGLQFIAFNVEDVASFASLPLLHRDPFDRILVAQAQARGLTIITPDAAIKAYQVATLW